MSNFWERVDYELEYKGMTRKALATEVGFNLGNIGKGIILGSIPAADTAIKIANVLGVSVEYLVTGLNPSDDKSKVQEQNEQIRLYKKYHELIEQIESTPPEKRELLKTALQADINLAK